MTKIIVLELVLIVGSVLIYRSLWLWLDQCPWLSTIPGSFTGFVLGVVMTIVCLGQLNKYIHKKQ